MKKNYLFYILFLLSVHLSLAQELKTPEAFLGYELGSQFSRHADVVAYFEYIAKNSAMVSYTTYGKTNERRPLTYAIISSEENLANIESIRKSHLNTTIKENSNADKAIVWLSYNVHGNEASSTEAAMKTIYKLITKKQDWLKNTIIIMDPCVNPDGRDRYVNWYNQVKASPNNTSQSAAEHHEPWPGGRANHYLFDLNRDWAWATQKETRQRLKIYNKWMPHIHVDFHEQGINNPYYFAPAAAPFHEVITSFQEDFQTRIGKNHAKYFDKEGWLYFTKQVFDLLYPSYGDTYPTYMGAIGMTYEQAGSGFAGLGIKTDEGYDLTLKDRIAHHYTTGISTVEVASQNTEELNEEFSKYFTASDLKYKSYVLSGNSDKIAKLQKLLDRHEINYSKGNAGRVKGFNYQTGTRQNFNTENEALIVSTNQPKGKMVKVLFEPETKLVDSLTYDITAWSLPYAYGLEAVASTKLETATKSKASEKVSNSADPGAAGYIAKWNSMQDASFLAALLNEGIKVRFSESAFKAENQKFAPGSLIITKSDNKNFKDFDSILIEIANKHQRKLVNASTGFAESGPDFGSSEVKIINKQRVGLFRGKETSSLNFGEIWYFFEQELEYLVTQIGTEYLNRVNFNEFDVLIMPEGSYGSLIKGEVFDQIKNWVRNGGKLIAIGNAIKTFAGEEDFDIKMNKEDPKDTISSPNLIPYAKQERENIKNTITGSIVKTKLDKTHPMAFGYGDTYFSLKLSSDSYALLSKGYNVSYINEPEIVAGFAGNDARKKIKNSLIFGEEPMGKGSFIYLVDNPLFRAFWENGKLFFVNSVFFVNNSGLTY